MNVGGPAVLLAELISELPFQEFSHTLITGVCENNEVDFLLNNPLDSEVIYLSSMRRSLFLSSEIRSFYQLVKVLRTISPDIVHTHTSKAGVLGRLAAHLATPNAKIVHTYHGHLLYGYFSKWKVLLLIAIEKALAKLTDVLVSVSNQVVKDLNNVGVGRKCRWLVIHPGIRIADSPRIINKGLFTISWIGRFTEIKDPFLAVRVFAFLKKNFGDDFRFIMLGNGDLWDEAKELARNLEVTIEFPGWVSPVDAILEESNLLLMTSLNEGVPVVIIEAAGYGVPTMTTDVGGVKEFVRDQETGFLVERGEAEIGNYICQLISNKDLLSIVSLNARSLAMSEFSNRNYLQAHLDLYRFLKSH